MTGLRLGALWVAISLLLMGFEWPGRLSRLEHELRRGEPGQRREAARQMASYPSADVAEALLGALEDPDPQVRLQAAAAVGQVGVPGAVPILTDWLNDAEPAVRSSAAHALGRIGDPRSGEALARLLADSRAGVRRAAVDALARIGGDGAVVSLLAHLDEADTSVRVAVIDALARIGDGRALVPLMAQAAEAAPEVRLATLRALGGIGDVRALPLLLSAIADGKPAQRNAAIAALGRLRLAGATDTLVERLQMPEPREAKLVLSALGQIGTAPALDAVVEALADPGLRPAAIRALVDATARANLPTPATAGGPEPGAAPAAEAATARPTPVAQLVLALQASTGTGAAAGPAEALRALGELTDIRPATDALLASLARSGDDGASPDPASDTRGRAALMTALAATGAPAAVEALLLRLDAGTGGDDPATRDAALAALASEALRGALDTRAADPLLAALPTLPAGAERQRAALARLLGDCGAPRAVPALVPLAQEGASQEVRDAALGALGQLGGPEAAAALLEVVRSPGAPGRFRAAEALGRTAGAREVDALLAMLTQHADDSDQHAALIALGPALARLDAGGQWPKTRTPQVLAQLAKLAEDGCSGVTTRVIDVLEAWHPEGALSAIAAYLRFPTRSVRARSARALAGFPDAQAKGLIRYLLSHASVPVTTAAVVALGETGNHQDLKLLTQTARRRHWPIPGAVAFAIARMAQRQQLRAEAAQRALCKLGRSREPYLRANVASAMAVLGGRPCADDGPSPLAWLGAGHAPAVRLAAAHWLWSAHAAGRIPADTAAEALLRCQRRDLDDRVVGACSRAPSPLPATPLDVYAYGARGRSLLRNRLVAVRFGDGSVMLAPTDDNGHLGLAAAPGGPITLEDPALQPLERR